MHLGILGVTEPKDKPLLSRMMSDAGVAVVVVGFPAAPLNGNRVRFCLSSSNTTAQLNYVLSVVSKIGDTLLLKHSNQNSLSGKIKKIN